MTAENPSSPEFSIAWMMASQEKFEKERAGTDGTLFQHNTLEHVLSRGVIGKAGEAVQELETGDMEALELELIDVMLFLSAAFVHAGMTPDRVIELVQMKLQINAQKYKPEHFENRTVQEAIVFSREQWQKEREYETAQAN